jgi:hypothetical protein
MNRFALNIVMALVVIVLLFSGNFGPALICLFAFAIVALRLGRRPAGPVG